MNSGRPLLENLLNNNDIVAIQEHWLRDYNIDLLQEINNNFDVVFETAMNESEHQYEKPFGGTVLLWRKHVLHNVNTFSIAEPGRATALSFYCNRGAYIIFNLYMSCHRNFNEEQSMQVLDCMSFREHATDEVLQSGATMLNLVVLGDFNSSVNMINDYSKLHAAKQLFDKLGLISCDYLDTSGLKYTYTNESLGCMSYIDHISVSKSIVLQIRRLEIIDNGINLSDHCPIECEFSLELNVSKSSNAKCDTNSNTRHTNIVWSQECKQTYWNLTGMKLGSFTLEECACMLINTICTNPECIVHVKNMCSSIVGNLLLCVKMVDVSIDRLLRRKYLVGTRS